MSDFPWQSAPEPVQNQGNAEVRADIPRDGRGRYVLPQLDGTPPPVYKNGSPIGITRASTIKGALTDQSGIHTWRLRLIAQALATTPDLFVKLAQAVALDSKPGIDAALEEAFVVGGGKDSSNRGTAMHLVAERIKRGETVDSGEVPEHYRRDVLAYLKLLSDNKIRSIRQEQVMLLPYGAAGTADDVVEWWNPETEEYEMMIADLKTGRDLSKGWLEIMIQLWLYANALAWWDQEQQSWEGAPPASLRKDAGLIFHVPMNGTATLYFVDLSGVQQYVEAAVTARRGHVEAKHKVRVIGEQIDTRGPTYVVGEQGPELTPAYVPPIVTKQMEADAQAAQQRLYIASTHTPMIEDEKATAEQLGQLVLPEDPLAPKPRAKRACSICRLTGHTAKKCPNLRAEGPSETVTVHGGEVVVHQVAPVACDGTHTAGWHPDPTNPAGPWLCATCNLPSQAEIRGSITRQALDGITTQNAVLDYRERMIAAGTWDATSETLAQQRWEQLSTERH